MYKLNTAPRASALIIWVSIAMGSLSATPLYAQINEQTPDAAKVNDRAVSDFDQPIRVRSDEQFVDAKEKTSIFEKNVVISQGSLIIDADYVKVDAGNGKGKEIFTIKGQPASYTQQLADGSDVQARANTIVYDIGIRTISLEGQAELVQNASTVKGDSIMFDMEREQMRAQGNGGNDQQVETIFTPDAIKSNTPKAGND